MATKFWTKEGTEGPRNDPYGYTTYCAKLDNGTLVELKVSGLDYEELKVNGQREVRSFGDNQEAAVRFKQLTGKCHHDIEELEDELGDYYGRNM